MLSRNHSVIIVLLAAAAVALVIWSGAPVRWAFSPTGTALEQGVTLADVDAVTSSTEGVDGQTSGPAVRVVAEGLRIPWEIVFLPDGDMLVTERPGTLQRIGKDGAVIEVPGVVHVGEGGLLGMALHPDFGENGFLYLYMTTSDGSGLTNRIERYVYREDALSDRTVVFSGIPGARYHDGGRIAFGPDGMLYVTTGDAGDGEAAQDRSSLAGKILRLDPEGGVPDGNPFGTPVWSFGHRNPQGIAWDVVDRLWETEHGRSGVSSGMDEINRIVPAGNYGWPAIEGDEQGEGMLRPLAHSGADETWAPGDVLWFDGRVFFTGLRGEALYEADVTPSGEIGAIRAHFRGDFGRLRALVAGPDRALYVSTSNTDGRGVPREADDRILRIDPSRFR